jgi:1-acyl-sn-glycerol-3-phosphate acyltransferase
MQNQSSSHPKPVTEFWRPEWVGLPRLTPARRIFRHFAQSMLWLIALLTMKSRACGMENFPKKGPALVIINHLGDADAVLLGASTPYPIDALGKIELHEHPVVGGIFRAYGVIWIHRGRPDRKALHAALEGLAEGRVIAMAPEGRESVTGALEDGKEGAAFIALKSGAPIVPVVMTGTENSHVYGHMKRFKRASVTFTVGKPFVLHESANRRTRLQDGTRQIMETLANMLPESYRGSYNSHS